LAASHPCRHVRAQHLGFAPQSLSHIAASELLVLLRCLGSLVDLIAERGSDLLDLACGHGRIAKRLAARGVRVTGLDATALFLDRARAQAAAAGLEVEYVQGDMRSLPWPERSFDRVISWFTSFGYFADDENRRVLREACRVLRPGGTLLIETNNLAELLPRWLLDAGFATVDFHDREGEPLTALSGRMIAIARR